MENKNLILGILFVAILLFGCVQNEVETPDVVDDVEDDIPKEEVDETDDTPENEDNDSIPELDDDNIIDEFVSQRCVYTDETINAVYLLSGNKMKMISESEGMVFEVIVDAENNIMYDKGGMMIMGMMSDCDWVRYDFDVIQAEMEAQGMASEDEDVIDDMVTMDDRVQCTNMVISDDEFKTSGKVCDGTEMMLSLISMAQQYK